MTATHNDTKTEFEFHELDKPAKERAICNYAHTVGTEFADPCLAEWTPKLKEQGFQNPNFYWSIGEGAAFAADFFYVGEQAEQLLTPEDCMKFTALKVRMKIDEVDSAPGLIISGKVVPQGRNCWLASSIRAEGDLSFSNTTFEYLEWYCGASVEIGNYTPLKKIQARAQDLARALAAELDAEYEYLTSEESFAELSACNEWRYDKKGNLL